jgi:hypothetical protein
MGLKLKKVLKLFFKKIETNHDSSSSCVFCSSLISNAQRTFIALQFAHPMTLKLPNLVKELGKY